VRQWKLALVGMVCCGCAAPRLYADPTADLGEYSKIELRNVSSTRPLFARLYDDAVTCSGVVNLSANVMKGIAPGEARVVYARKDEPFTVGAWFWGAGMQCHVSATFVPTADEYAFSYETTDSLSECGVLPTEGGREPRVVPPDRFFLRPFHTAFANSGPWCEPLPETARRAIVPASVPAGR
jgi:hypothetical protein